MEELIDHAVKRLVDAGLATPGTLLLGGIDDVVVWNRPAPETRVLTPLFEQLGITAMLFGRPAEPYAKVIEFLATGAKSVIRPEDTESRTFLHEIEVAPEFSTDILNKTLSRRKSVVLPGGYVAAAGALALDQAYLHFSSVCFAALVKFLSNLLTSKRNGTVSREAEALFEEILPVLPRLPDSVDLMSGPFHDQARAEQAMAEAGRAVVRYRLVDSFFGNISYRIGETLYISQSGSALDNLEGVIIPAAMDGRSSAAVTASSELSAHLQIVKNEPVRAILHGHPVFSVVLSMDCHRDNCERRGQCHLRCPEERSVGDVPIIPGEVGTGPFGIATTLPPAIHGRDGVIVYGHGVFTVGRDDFNDAFARLVAIEKMCRDLFIARMTTQSA